jgi:membrane protease YdiL (CAAX protease family)
LILVFFLLTYAMMWTCFLSVAFSGISAQTPLGGGLLLLGTFAPSIMALALTAYTEGKGAALQLLNRVMNPPAAMRWYVFAVTFIPIVKLVAAIVHRGVLGVWPRFGTEPLWLLPLAVAFSTPFQIGEELGWRGFALPRLAARLGFGGGSVLLGIVWAFWHVPQFFVREADTYGQSFLIFLLQVMALSVVMAWLYVRVEGSLLPLMVMHAAVNNTKDIVPSATPGATNSFTSLHASPIAWLTVAILGLAAVWFLTQMKTKR